MVKKLEAEISSLKRELAMHDTLTNRSQITYDPLSEQQRYEIKQQVRNYLDGNLDEIDVSILVYKPFRELLIGLFWIFSSADGISDFVSLSSRRQLLLQLATPPSVFIGSFWIFYQRN